MSQGTEPAPVRVRLFAAAADVVGSDVLKLEGVATVGELLDAVTGGEERQREVLEQCSVLVDGARSSGPEDPVPAGVTVDILPPFAGG